MLRRNKVSTVSDVDVNFDLGRPNKFSLSLLNYNSTRSFKSAMT